MRERSEQGKGQGRGRSGSECKRVREEGSHGKELRLEIRKQLHDGLCLQPFSALCVCTHIPVFVHICFCLLRKNQPL